MFSEQDVVQPDLVYFEPDRLHMLSNRRVARVPPDLAVEVLSAATAPIDRGRKMEMLARYGVREYWLVDPDVRSVEIYELRGHSFLLAQTAREDDAISSPLLGALGGATAALFRSPVA